MEMLDMPVTTGTMDTDTPVMPDMTTLLTAAEAARLLGVSERTVRRWISAGDLPGVRLRGSHGPEIRVTREAVSAYRLIQPPAGTRAAGGPDKPDAGKPAMPVMPDSLPDKPVTLDKPDTVLRARLDGAQLAARLHAERRRHVERQAERDRDEARAQQERLHAEVEFLRLQLQQRTDAERELRLLLASTSQAIQAMSARPALEAAAPPGRTAWWRLWKRG